MQSDSISAAIHFDCIGQWRFCDVGTWLPLSLRIEAYFGRMFARTHAGAMYRDGTAMLRCRQAPIVPCRPLRLLARLAAVQFAVLVVQRSSLVLEMHRRHACQHGGVVHAIRCRLETCRRPRSKHALMLRSKILISAIELAKQRTNAHADLTTMRSNAWRSDASAMQLMATAQNSHTMCVRLFRTPRRCDRRSDRRHRLSCWSERKPLSSNGLIRVVLACQSEKRRPGHRITSRRGLVPNSCLAVPHWLPAIV